MYQCPNCGSKSKGNFCARCGSQTVPVPKKPKKAGPIFRLTVAALCSVGIWVMFVALAISMGQLPRFNELLAIVGTSGMVTGCLVGTLLLAVYTVPPMFRVANRFCSSLVALSLYGFFLKMMIWPAIVLFPLGVGTALMSSLISMSSLLLTDPNNYLALLLFAAIGVVTMLASISPDVIRLVRCFKAKPVFR